MIRRLSDISTGRLAVRLGLALVVSTVVAALVSGWAFRAVSHTAEDVRTRSTQAALELSATRGALIDADAAAVGTFSNSGADLAAPGQDYQNQIAAAAQSLARFAQLNGARDVQNLQVVEGMLASYSSSIGQADAYEHQDSGRFLAANEVWNASQLIHMPGGILDQLQSLQAHQRSATESRIASGWLSSWTIAVWAALLALVLGLLIGAQIMCRRRFRRQFNIGLLGATVLTLALIGVMVFTAVSAHRLRAAQDSLDQVISSRTEQMARTDSAGQFALAGMLKKACSPCGYTVAHFTDGLHSASAVPSDAGAINRQTRVVTERMNVAAETYGLGIAIPVLAVVILFGIGAGLFPRINEYRFDR
ncbi:MAG TPA: hypothetical protein VHC49_23400 [Mycobacteriales bacterium]|nr:hypothetical protein [Mycobacteriales bacterium]